ncbi:MAG: hypothetical protein K8R25_04340, partial [Methanosarcinales archaeon]|nr:hypothetical protein [Methanosarcinales archaeon]
MMIALLILRAIKKPLHIPVRSRQTGNKSTGKGKRNISSIFSGIKGSFTKLKSTLPDPGKLLNRKKNKKNKGKGSSDDIPEDELTSEMELLEDLAENAAPGPAMDDDSDSDDDDIFLDVGDDELEDDMG